MNDVCMNLVKEIYEQTDAGVVLSYGRQKKDWFVCSGNHHGQDIDLQKALENLLNHSKTNPGL